MSNSMMVPGRKIDKRHIEASVLFAINHIPKVDEQTLATFLELVNLSGNFGSISDQQLIHKMALLTKLVPNVCQDSLLALAQLLDICVPVNIGYTLNLSAEEIRQPC